MQTILRYAIWSYQIDIPLNFILTHENIKKMINLNVIKRAVFLPVKDKKSSLSNSARLQNVERFKVVATYVLKAEYI